MKVQTHKRTISSPFPQRKFRLMAGSQMLLGMACIVLGGIDMILARHRMSLCYESRESQYERRIEKELAEVEGVEVEEEEGFWAMDNCYRMMQKLPFCAAIMCCAMIFIVTGSLGFGAAKTNINHRQSGLKNGYMVLNILCTVLIGPTMFLLLAVAAFLPYETEIGIETVAFKGQVAVTVLQAQIALLSWLLCIVAGCVSCCCAPTVDQVKIVQIGSNQQHGGMTASSPRVTVDDKANLLMFDLLGNNGDLDGLKQRAVTPASLA